MGLPIAIQRQNRRRLVSPHTKTQYSPIPRTGGLSYSARLDLLAMVRGNGWGTASGSQRVPAGLSENGSRYTVAAPSSVCAGGNSCRAGAAESQRFEPLRSTTGPSGFQDREQQCICLRQRNQG